VVDDIIDEADRRRGHGPWDDSAQHCWAACYFGIMFGGGLTSAILADLGEAFGPSCDTARDIAAHHLGGALGDLLHRTATILSFFPDMICDRICLTWP
jgi:hypothetical protein